MKKSVGTILLCEDNEHDIELTLATLESFWLSTTITVVRDGAEALDYLMCKGQYKSRDCVMPAVILLDIKMPKIDGLQVLEVVKTHPELRSVPVVMLTSSRQERDLVQSYALGVNAYVVKPVDYEQFSEAIKQLGVFWALINETPNSQSYSDNEK